MPRHCQVDGLSSLVRSARIPTRKQYCGRETGFPSIGPTAVRAGPFSGMPPFATTIGGIAGTTARATRVYVNLT
jgi:hypothetical protein